MQPTADSALYSPADHLSDPSLQTVLTALIEAEIETIRALPAERLCENTQNIIPSNCMPNLALMKSLSPSKTTDALLVCLLLRTLSGGTEVLREFQIMASLK
jgi:hypothetical protein